MMKIALILTAIVLVVGLALVPMGDTQTKDGKILCCHDGKCDTEHTLIECAKLGGKVVKNCKECQ